MRPPSRVAGVLLGVAVGSACGSGSRPPALVDGLTQEGGVVTVDSGGGLITEGGLNEQSCGVGPDGGVCACADEPLAGDPPNLYFMLDRSGSMNDFGKWGTVQITLERLVIALGPRVRVGAAVFPDPAQDACAPGVEVVPPTLGDVPAGTAGPNETALLERLGHIAANGGTPTAATLTSLAPHIEGFGGHTYVILATDGGPNCDSAASCTADMCTDNIEGQAGCPVGGPPNCCADPNLGGAQACLDAQPTIDAVTSLAAAGVPVYVVGVPGSEPYAALLDQLAVAGGTGRGSEPQYYAVTTTDQAALFSAMSKVAARIAGTCTLTLDATPPDATLVNVYLDGQVLPQSGADGWTLVGTTVTILGASCQAIESGDVLDVRVVAGCPTVEL